MNETATTLPKELPAIFHDWAVQCEALARPLPNSSLARAMLCQAAESLTILSDAGPDYQICLVKPITIYRVVSWVAQWMLEWPAPGKCTKELVAEIEAVLTWMAIAVGAQHQ